MMKKCKNCGAEITEGMIYCGSCGTAQDGSTQNGDTYGSSQQDNYQNTQWNSGQQYGQDQWNTGQQQYGQNQWGNGQQQYGQNQWNNAQQYGQNQWNNGQQYGQNQWNNGQQQYGQNQWNNGQQYGQNQWGNGQQQYGQNQWNNGQQYGQNQWNQPTGAYSFSQPMKWYKFIIYFQLFAAMVLNIISGISAFTGAQYGDDTGLVYYYYDGLKTVDILMGIACILLAVGDLVARQKLSGFKRDAIRWYLGVMAATAVVTVVYLIAVCAVTGLSVTNVMGQGNLRISIWTAVVMIAVNYTYFQKRRNMFCN